MLELTLEQVKGMFEREEELRWKKRTSIGVTWDLGILL